MTEKLFDNGKLYKFEAKVVSCTEVKKGFEAVLDKTAFFPEGGGQPADAGTLGGIEVLDVQEKDGEVVHKLSKPLEVGSEVVGIIDENIRLRRMQNHSGEHLLSGIIHSKFGYNNVGFHLGSSDVTLDLDGALTAEDISECELKANQAIAADKPIKISYPSPEILENLDYRSKLEMTENVRIVTIEDYDVCACCAPHVGSTGQIGMVKIIGFESYKGGTRIHMLCGLDALDDYNKKLQNALAISRSLSVKQDKIAQAVEKLSNENSELKRQISAFQKEKVEKIIAEISDAGNSGANRCVFVSQIDSNGLREIANAGVELTEGAFGVFCENDESGYNYIIASKAVKLREKSREINSALNGRGGGSDAMIQGSLKSSASEILGFFENFGG